MPKKAANQGKKTPNARDIQTPASDRDQSTGASPKPDGSPQTESKSAGKSPSQAESSQANIEHSAGAHASQAESSQANTDPSVGAFASQAESSQADSKAKEPASGVRFDKSPTRFAPNAGGHNSDVELEDASDESDSDQHPPQEDEPEPLTDWVKDVIRTETARHREMMGQIFMSKRPDLESCQGFFTRLNQLIRGANEEHGANDLDAGIIPESGYRSFIDGWNRSSAAALESGSTDSLWAAFNTTHALVKKFNERYSLPRNWNLSQAAVEEAVGSQNPNPVIDDLSPELATPSPRVNTNPRASEDLSESSESETEETSMGLDALEARTIKQQRQLTSAKVLYWWPKGTGSQIFVRYGSRETPIYRIRAGSHEIYDRSKVERVLSTTSRGGQKVTGQKDGIPEEFWRFKREHVKDILAIGWKIEDDDENGVNALDYLQPAKGAIYPHTQALVKWKDGVTTPEGRAFIRRITTGSALEGDRVIYQRAKELEVAYRERHGLEGFDDSDYHDDDSDSDDDDSFGRKAAHARRHRSEPLRQQKGKKNQARKNTKYDTSESGTESDSSTQQHTSQSRRHRSEPVHYQKSKKRQAKKKSRHGMGDSTTESDSSTQYRSSRARRYRGESTRQRKSHRQKGGDDTAHIKRLEREIQRLKLGQSKPDQGRRRGLRTY